MKYMSTDYMLQNGKFGLLEKAVVHRLGGTW